MGKADLSLDQTRDMLLHIAQTIVESKEILTHADQAIGDGDHGIGMARGFEEVRRRLEGSSFASVGDLLKTTGTALMSSIGGASGAIFGTFFRASAAGLLETQEFGSRELALMLTSGLRGVKERGKTGPGSKTMVDALAPAAERALALEGETLDRALQEVAEAARLGMESTKGMLATTGKAKTLGERSLGHADPGAISTYLIIKSMAEYSAGQENK